MFECITVLGRFTATVTVTFKLDPRTLALDGKRKLICECINYLYV